MSTRTRFRGQRGPLSNEYGFTLIELMTIRLIQNSAEETIVRPG